MQVAVLKFSPSTKAQVLAAVELKLETSDGDYPTARWKIGANCWETRPPSAPCSTAYCTTATCSSAVRGACAPKPTCQHRRRQGRTFSVLDGHSRWPVLK